MTTVTRFVKPDAARFFTTFLKALGACYALSIPLTFYWIQTSGLGFGANEHLSIVNVFFAVLMISVLWAPVICMTYAWFLIPVTAIVALVAASIRRDAVVDDPLSHPPQR